jgi:hypothetical protein
MKNFIVKLGSRLFIPTSMLMIAYCIFYQYLANIPYLFIIKLILLASFVFQFISWMISTRYDMLDENDEQSIVEKNAIVRFYLKAGRIITQIYCYYFALYLLLMLDKKSIFYNYLLLFLFGLLLGYRLAKTSWIESQKKS